VGQLAFSRRLYRGCERKAARETEKKRKEEKERTIQTSSYVDHLGFEFINSESISSREQHKNFPKLLERCHGKPSPTSSSQLQAACPSISDQTKGSRSSRNREYFRKDHQRAVYTKMYLKT